MKEIKKFISLILIFILFTALLLPKVDVSAKTLGELKEELRKVEEEYQNAEQAEQDKENQIDINNETITQIELEVSEAEKDMEQLANEIEALNIKIEKKEKELKNLIKFLGQNENSNTYLTYAFGADDLTEFIYRVSVGDQLAEYNETLIEDSKNLVEENKIKTKELETTQDKLEEDKKRLDEEIKKLGAELSDIAFIKIDTAEEIRLQKEAIEVLESIGCKDNEDINSCGDKLPSDTAFLRPMENAYVTSEYGYRCLNGVCAFHEAIDMSTVSKTGDIYSAANGIVIGTRVKSSCGGNVVFIIHEVNGKKYTTEYAHLRTIDVTIGQTVTKNTVIGTMGGNKYTETWDNCSEVAHLHFGIAEGHYLKDYYSNDTFIANTFDPREIINFPWTGGSVDPFGDRYEKY